MHLSSVYAHSTAPTIFPGMNYLGKSSTAFFVWYFPHMFIILIIEHSLSSLASLHHLCAHVGIYVSVQACLRTAMCVEM